MKRVYFFTVFFCFIFISLSESFIDQEDLSGLVGVLQVAVKELQGKVKMLENQTKCGKYK